MGIGFRGIENGNYYSRIENALQANLYPYIGNLPIRTITGLIVLKTSPMSAETMNKALKIMGYQDEQTGYGFRSMASTIMNEAHLFRWEAIDAQLAHKKKYKTEATYNHEK